MSIQKLRDQLNSLGSSDFTAESFVSCSNALLDLSVKNIKLPEDIKILLLYKQHRFMVRNLARNSEPEADKEELLKSIDRLVDAFEPLKLNANDVLNVDDETLLRMKLILSELCFLRNSERLELIPLKEMAFCVTMLILVFKEKEEYRVYRLVLNRRNVTTFLKAIVSSLQDFKKGHFEASLNRKMFNKIAKTYKDVHKLYILKSVQEDISALTKCRKNDCTELFALHEIFDIVSQNGEYFRYVKPFFANVAQFAKQLPTIEHVSKLLILFHLKKFINHFLNKARSCKTVDNLKSLFRYVEDLDFIRFDMALYDENVNLELKMTLKCLENFNVSLFYRLLFNSKFEHDFDYFIKIIDSNFIEFDEYQIQKMLTANFKQINTDIIFETVDNQINFKLVEDPRSRIESIVSSMQTMLSTYNFSTIDLITSNYTKIPGKLRIALRYLLKHYFQALKDSGIHFKNQCYDNDDHCNYIMFFSSDFYNLVITLVLTEVSFKEMSKSDCQKLAELSDLKTNGMKLLQTHMEILKSFRNVEVLTTEYMESEDWDRKYLLSMERTKGPNYYCLETVMGVTLAEFSKNDDVICGISSKINSKELKLHFALAQEKYSEAFSMCPSDIRSYDERMFAWNGLIDALVVSGVELTTWNQETVTLVAEKLAKFGNSQSLEKLREFHDLQGIVAMAISTGDDDFVLKVFKEFSEEINEFSLTAAIAAHQNNAVLSVLKEQPENKTEFVLVESARLKNYKLFENVMSFIPKVLPKAFQATIIHNRPQIVKKLLNSSVNSLIISKALYTAVQLKRWKIANILLNEGRADPNFRFSSEYSEYDIPVVTAFQGAVAGGKLGFLKKCSIDVDLNRDLSLITLAASSVSLDLLKYLVKLGFNAAHEPEAVPCVLAIGYTKIWEDTVECLNVRPWEGPDSTHTSLYLEIEQLKALGHLEQIFFCEEFQKSASPKLMRLVAKRIKLYKTFQNDFYVDNIEVTDLNNPALVLYSFQRHLKQNCLNMALQKNIFHFYSSIPHEYVFCELTFVIPSEIYSDDNEEVTELLEEANITCDLVLEKILEKFDESFENIFKIFDIKMYEGDTLRTRFKVYQLNNSSCTVELQQNESNHSFDNTCLNIYGREILEDISSKIHFQMAIGSGDVPSLAQLLCENQAEEYVGLNSDLFKMVVDYDGTEQTGMAVMLLEVGLKSWTLNLTLVRSIIDYAISKDRLELAQLVLSYDCFGLTSDEELEKVIQYGSIAIYELFLSIVSYDKAEMFKQVCNALQSLSCKEVEIKVELQMYLQYQLANFGFEHLCADPKTPKNYGEWLESIDFLVEWTNILSNRADSNSYLGIDNEVLFRFRMIHNQLYLIKDNVHLKKIPIREVTFLLAIFLKIFKDKEYDMYRMVINKPLLMKFLTSISSDLNAFQLEFKRVTSKIKSIMTVHNCRTRHVLEPVWKADPSLPNLSDNIWNRLSSKKFKDVPFSAIIDEVLCTEFVDFTYPKSRRTFGVITETFFRVKQMYSLCKITKSLDFNKSLILSQEKSAEICQDQSGKKECYVTIIKRFTQIFGECIKSTSNTPNIPKAISKVLETVLWSEVQQNKTIRDVSCHKFPMIKKFLTVRDLFVFYMYLPKYLLNVEIIVKILVVSTCFQYFRWHFNSLLRSSSLKTLRELICFVGDQTDLVQMQVNYLDDVNKFCMEDEKTRSEKLLGNCAPEMREIFMLAKKHGEKRAKVLSCLENMKISNFFYDYETFQAVAFSTLNVRICHRMIEMNLVKSRISKESFYKLLTENWFFLNYDAPVLISSYLPDSIMGAMVTTQKMFEIETKALQKYYCKEDVARICDFLLAESDLSLQERLSLEAALYHKLDKFYFKDIFLIDSKFDAIDKVMPKEKIPRFASKVQNIRIKNQKELKQLTQDLQLLIQKLLKKHNCETISQMIANWKNIPTESVLAFEFWMLELSEILITTKQFQDNFHTIKADVQMICGRNFRNYLAHDSISYDLLTNSSRMKVLVNALAMVNIEWKLFSHPEKRNLPEIKNVKEAGISIILGQDCFKRSVIEQDFDCFSNRGGLPLGKFWTAIGPYGGLQSLSIAELVNYNECEKNLDLKLFKPDKSSNINYKLYNNIRKDDFETALEMSGKDSWSAFFESFKFPVSVWRSMGRLVKFLDRKGDISAVFDLINHFGSKLESTLMLVGSQELKSITLTVKPSLLLLSHVNTIVRSDSLSDLQNMDFLLSSIEVLSPDVLNLLQEIVCCNNIYAFKFVIENFEFNSFEDAERILINCVVSGRFKMVEVFTKKYANNSFNLDRALQMAAAHNRESLVKHLQVKGANLVEMDSFRKIGVTHFGCLKYVKQFPIVLPEGYHLHVELPNVDKFSLADMELLVKSGYYILRSHQFFRYVLKSEDERILSLVENNIFDFKCVTLCFENVTKWLRIVRECKVLNYLTANLLIHCMKNKPDLFGRILNRINLFGMTDEGYGVEIVNQFGNAELDTSALDLCMDVEKCLENSEDVSFETRFERELLCIDSHETVQIVKVLYKIYGIKELPKIAKFEQIACFIEYSTFHQIYQNVLQILKNIEILEDAKIVTIEYEYSNILYRVLKISTNTVILRCLGKMSPIQEMINTKDANGRTILFDVKTFKIFKLLIECGADLSVENNDDESPLPGYILWPWSELEPVFEYCLEHDVCTTKGVHLFHAKTRWNLSLLTVAVVNGAAEAVQFLISNGVDHTAYELGGFFPLLAAVSLQRIDVVEVLLDHSHETVNRWRKGHAFTPLLQAVTRNNAILVKMLLDAGADVSFPYCGYTIFGVAIERQAGRALKALLEHTKLNKSNVVADYNTNSSPIQSALLTGNVEMFQIVLEWEIEGSLENLTASSIERMKKCFNEPRSNGNSIYALCKFTGNLKIIEFIHKCVELGEQVLGGRIELDTNVNLDKMVDYTMSAVDIVNLVDNCDVF